MPIIAALSDAGFLWTRLSLPQAMCFGALISSTDPVATLSTLKQSRATPLLYDLVFGESALNDALSIVLFGVFRAHLHDEAGASPSSEMRSLDVPKVLPAARRDRYQ